MKISNFYSGNFQKRCLHLPKMEVSVCIQMILFVSFPVSLIVWLLHDMNNSMQVRLIKKLEGVEERQHSSSRTVFAE